jgi:hypothetical protein
MYRVEVRLGVVAELEPWLTIAVGRTPESAPGCYSWSFVNVDEARRTERALRHALRDNTAQCMRDRGSLPSSLANAVRACTVHVLRMALTELPVAAA